MLPRDQVLFTRLTEKTRSRTFALRVELLLDHRLCWLSCGYGVCVPMYHLPRTVFRPKDHRDPQCGWGEVLHPAHLDLHALYPHRVRELGSHVLRHGLAMQVDRKSVV